VKAAAHAWWRIGGAYVEETLAIKQIDAALLY
jgi:hypothetical protein